MSIQFMVAPVFFDHFDTPAVVPSDTVADEPGKGLTEDNLGQSRELKRALLGAAALSAFTVVPLGVACADTHRAAQTVEVRTEASSLGDALRSFSAQTGIPVIFSERQVSGRTVDAMNGQFAPAAGLGKLLAGTGLEAVQGEGGTFVLRTAEPSGRAVPAAEGREPPTSPDRLAEPEPASDSPELRAETVTVTGTSLRGFAPESSPLQMYSREDILGSGVTTTEQFIRTLPQNFGGGSTEFAAVIGLPNDSNSQFNSTFGTSANLRGLGSRGTLTLLDGKRMAPTSEIGDFIDLSMIPLSAIERVDVLTDGASSIYGGDAVAGVMNFILRDDFDGAETSLRYGAVTRGDMEEYRFSQTLGRAWGSGNVLGTYEIYDRDSLTLADRPQIPAPILPGGAPDLNDFDLLPAQRRQSGVISLRQQIGGGAELLGSGLYSNREADSTTFSTGSTITTSNYRSRSELASLALGLSYDLAAGWRGGQDLTFSRVHNRENARNVAPVASDPRIKTTRSELWSFDTLFDGPVIRLPAGDINAAVGGHYREEDFSNALETSGVDRAADRIVSALFGEILVPVFGPENRQPLAKRLEVSLSGRYDDYSDYGSRFSPKVGVLWAPAESLRVRGSFSESFAPPPLGRVGDLGRTGAVMPYANILRIFNVEAPLPELADMNYLQVVGTAGDLEPETSSTLTLGFDAEGSRGAHNWSLRSTYYDISFEGRLGATPIPQNLNANLAPGIAYQDPSAFPEGTVIFFPAEADIDRVLATFNQPVIFIGGVTSVSNIGIINNAFVVRNLAATETSGVDVQLDYDVETELGAFNAGVNANYILDFRQQASVTSPEVETLDTFLNPVALQLRANAGYLRGGFAANLFVNYRDSYKTDGSPSATDIGSWTTADLSLSYALEAPQNPWLNGVQVNLNVTNLFDQLPPVTPTNGTYRITGFDPTNANPLRRFVSLEVRKAF